MSSTGAPSDETAGAGTDRRHRVIGRHVLRRQDPALLTGRGMFVADVQRPGTLHMAVLRSRYAHARIAGIDTTACRLVPGVALTLTARDLAGLAKPLPVLRQGARLKGRDYPVLPADKAIYVGQPLAAVVATNRARAEDALEKIVVDYEPLPVVASVEGALRPGAPVLHEAWGDNIANGLTHETGDVSGALAEAAVVLTREFRIGRVTALPLEGRGVVAEYDRSTERLTVWYSSQAPHLFRTVLAGVLGFPEGRIHVIVRDVGGGFGLKLHYHAEEVRGCRHAAPGAARQVDRGPARIVHRLDAGPRADHRAHGRRDGRRSHQRRAGEDSRRRRRPRSHERDRPAGCDGRYHDGGVRRPELRG
jgi:carbon-monoxide dehydrogenase large subunit